MIDCHAGCGDAAPFSDLSFEPVEKSYMKVVYIRIFIVYIILMALAPLVLLLDAECTILLIVAELLLVAAFAANLALVNRIWRFKGYLLGDSDISYRSGVVFPRVKTVPFCKIQQVSVRLNPVSRLFGLYYVDVINGSQSAVNTITIPGLSQEKAQEIKSLLIANSCSDDERLL